MKKFILRHKYLLIFLVVLFVIGLLSGVILYLKQSEDLKNILVNNLTDIKFQLINNHISNIIPHLIIITIIVALSFTIIGYLFGLFYLFYIATSISFSVTYLTINHGLNGLIFGFLYNLIFKSIYILAIIFILLKTSFISKNIFNMIFIKNNNTIKLNIKKYIIQIILIIFIIFINDILLYFISSFTLKILTIML